MELNFSDFSSEFQKKYKEAIKDKQITYDEFKKFSKEDQLKLRSIFDSNPETFNGIDIYTKEYRNEGSALSLKIGHENDTTGIITINDKIKQKYPLAAYGKLNNGEITLYDKNNKALIDDKGNVVVYKMSEEYIDDLNVSSVVGNFQFIENEPADRTNRRFAVALILSRYDGVISQMQSFLSQLGVLDVGFWRETLGIGIQALADLKDNQETITATTMKKIDRVKAEREQIAADFDRLIDSPADFENKFYQLFGKDYRDNAISELRDIMHNQENKDSSTKYKECKAKLDELYPDDNIESWEDSLEFQQTVDKIADIVVMFVMTGGIGTLFRGSVQKIAMNILKAAAKGDRKAVMMNFAKLSPEVQTIYQSLAKKEFGVAAAQVVTPITQSAATFATWEGLKAFVNGATNAEDLSPEELLSRILEGIKSGAELGVVMGSLETFAIGPVMKLLTPMINKLSGASSEISNLMKSGNDVVSMDKVMEVYSKTSQTLRGKIAKEGTRAIVSLPAFTVGFTGVDTAFHYDENEYRKLLLDSATSDEERDAINNMDSFALRMKFAEEDFKNQVKGMATIEGVGLIFRRLQAGRIASQALQNDKATNIISANLVKTADNKYEIRTKNGNVLSINDGNKTISSFNSIEEATAAYSTMCMDLYSEFVAAIEEANKKQQTENDGFITELDTEEMPQTNNFKNFMQELKEQHVSFDLYELEDGRKLVRIEDSTKMLTDNRFTYLEYDSEGALSDAYTDISKADAKNIFTDFANTERRFISNKTRTLNSGLNPEPLMEAGKAHSKLRAVKEEIQNGKKSKKITPEVQARITKIREFLEANQDRPVTMQEIAEHCGISEASANKMVHDKNYGLSDIYVSPQQFATRNAAQQIKAVLEEAVKNNERVTLAGIVEKTNLTFDAVVNLLRPENAEKFGLTDLWKTVKTLERPKTDNDTTSQKEPVATNIEEWVTNRLKRAIKNGETLSISKIAAEAKESFDKNVSFETIRTLIYKKENGIRELFDQVKNNYNFDKHKEIAAACRDAAERIVKEASGYGADKSSLLSFEKDYVDYLADRLTELNLNEQTLEVLSNEFAKLPVFGDFLISLTSSNGANRLTKHTNSEYIPLLFKAYEANPELTERLLTEESPDGNFKFNINSALYSMIKDGLLTDNLAEQAEESPELVSDILELNRTFGKNGYTADDIKIITELNKRMPRFVKLLLHQTNADGVPRFNGVQMQNLIEFYFKYPNIATSLMNEQVTPQGENKPEFKYTAECIEEVIKTFNEGNTDKIKFLKRLLDGDKDAYPTYTVPDLPSDVIVQCLRCYGKTENIDPIVGYDTFRFVEYTEEEMQELAQKAREYIEQSYYTGKNVGIYNISSKIGVSESIVKQLLTSEKYGLSKLFIPNRDTEFEEIYQIKSILEDAIQNRQNLSIHDIASRMGVDFAKAAFYLTNAAKNGLFELWDKVQKFKEAPEVTNEPKVETDLSSGRTSKPEETTGYEFKAPKYGTSAPALRRDANGTYDELFAKGQKMVANFAKNFKNGAKMTEPKIITVGNNHFGFTIDKKSDGTTRVIVKNWLGDKASWDKPAYVEKTFVFELDANGQMTQGTLSWNNYYESKAKTDYSYTFTRSSNGKGVITYREDYYGEDKQDYKTATEAIETTEKWYVPDKNDNNSWNESVEGLETLEYEADGNGLLNMFLDYARADRGVKTEETKESAKEADVAEKAEATDKDITPSQSSESGEGAKNAGSSQSSTEGEARGENTGVNPSIPVITPEMQAKVDKLKTFLQNSYARNKFVSVEDISRELGISTELAADLITNEAYGLSKVYIQEKGFYKQNTANKIKAILEEALNSGEKITPEQIGEKLGVRVGKIKHYLNPKYAEQYGIKDTVERFMAEFGSPELDNLALLETHYNTRRMAVIKEAETVQKEVFAQVKVRLQELIESVKPGNKMDERATITIGNNTVTIFVDKTRPGNTNVTVKNYMGKMKNENHAEVESTMHFRLDESGELQFAKINYEEYYPEDDVIKFQYRYIKQPDGQFVIDSKKTYYRDMTYVINQKPLWERTEQYKPASDDLTTWECSSHDGVRPVEDRIEYNPEESGIRSMFFEFFTDRTKVKTENKKTVSDSNPSKPVSSPETPIASQISSSSAPAAAEASSQKYEFKKPEGFVSATLLQEEAYGTKDELFAKGERLLENMIKNLPQNAEIKEPKVITAGNNHFGFTIENTPDGTRLVTVKNWLGDKASWELAAKVEEVLRFELDEDGNMIEGKFSWADASDNKYKAEHSYTFERQTNGDCSIKYQEDVYGQYSYRHTTSPFMSEERTYVRSPQNPDAWVAKEDFDELLEGESWLFHLSDGDTSTIEPEFGYDSGEASLMNVFLNYARTNRTETSTKQEAAPIQTKPAASVTETPIQAKPSRVSDNASVSDSEAVAPEHPKAPLSNVVPPHRKNISQERAKAALAKVKDKIDIEKLKKYIPVDVYKKAVINELALDLYIDSVIERIVYNSGSLLPETKTFLKDIIKSIVMERVQGVKKPESQVMSEINAQLDKEFSDIATSISDKPLQVKDLFGRKEILEILKAQGLNSGEIATLINTTAPSMRKILSENGVVIDGRKKAQASDGNSKTGNSSDAQSSDTAGQTTTPPTPPKVIDKKTEQSIFNKRAKGMSIVQIAMSSNLDVVDVARMLKAEGVLDRNSTEKKLDLAKIIKLYRANIESIEDIARNCGCSAQDVDLALRRVGLRKPRKMPDQKKVAKILFMIRNDYSTPIHKIALEVGESDIYVMQRIAEAGLMTKSQLKPEAAVAFNFEKELLSLYEFGISISDMQEIFDCSSEALIETLQKYDKMNAKSKLKNPENYEEIRLCKEQGLGAADIASLLDEDFELVMDVIHELKVLSGIKNTASTSATATSDSGKTNPSGNAQGGNSSGNVSGVTSSGDAGRNVQPAGTYTLRPEYKEQIDNIIKYVDEYQSVLKKHPNKDVQQLIELAPDVLSGKIDFKDVENLVINILIFQEEIQEEIFNYELSHSKYFMDKDNTKYYDNWKENIKGKINLSVEEYYTLRTKYQMTDSQIFYDNDNILEVFGVTNFEELTQFIDSYSSYGGRTTIQSIFKTFGQKNIAGLKQYLKDNNISGFGSSNISSSYIVRLSFNGRDMEILDNFDYFSKVFHNTHGPITLPADYESVSWSAINKEFTLKHKFNFVRGLGSDYKGYPKLLSYMGIDYQNCPNIEAALNLVQNSNTEKFRTLSRVLNNPKISSTFPTIHGRMRFIERILLTQGVDLEDTNAINTFLDSFFNDMKNSLNQGVVIERYDAVNGNVGAKLTFTMRNGQTISVTLNEEGLIHTIY